MEADIHGIVKCPNCGKVLHKNFCMHCGYMTNGVYIGKNPPESISDVEMYLGDRYDTINRNKNSALAFFLGPFYFYYNKFIFTGFLAMIFDFLFCGLAVLLFDKRVLLASICSFFTLRIGYATVANMICLWLWEIKVKHIKKKHKENYTFVLSKMSNNTKSFLYIILGLMVFLTAFFVILLFMTNRNG